MSRKPVLHFTTQKECKAAVRAEVDPYRETDEIFEAPVTKQLLAKRHHACVKHGLVPMRFCWGIHPIFNTRDCFLANFNDVRFPQLDWRKISWNKALIGWRLTDATLDGEIKAVLRRHILPHILAYRDVHDYCEYPGCLSLVQDIDHINPQFDDIACTAIAMLTQLERASMINSYSWIDDCPLQIPARVLDYMDEQHSTVVRLQALCKFHHIMATRMRHEPT